MRLSRNQPRGKTKKVEVEYKCGCKIIELLFDNADLPKYLEMSKKMICKECWQKEAEK